MRKIALTQAAEWSKYKHLFKRIEVPAKTLLLKEGEVSKTILSIESGCLRTWMNSNGKDITTQFFFERDSVSSIESFKTQKPSLQSIESLEPSVLQSISYSDFLEVMNGSSEIKQQIEDHIFSRLVHCQQLFLSHLRDTPQTRYKNLLEQHPEIIKRVPQHYIASYLGITPVSLSRIRSRR